MNIYIDAHACFRYPPRRSELGESCALCMCVCVPMSQGSGAPGTECERWGGGPGNRREHTRATPAMASLQAALSTSGATTTPKRTLEKLSYSSPDRCLCQSSLRKVQSSPGGALSPDRRPLPAPPRCLIWCAIFVRSRHEARAETASTRQVTRAAIYRRASLALCSRTFPKLGRTRPKSGQTRAKLGRNLPRLVEPHTNLDGLGPNAAERYARLVDHV